MTHPLANLLLVRSAEDTCGEASVKLGAGYSYVLYLGRGEDGRKQQKWVGGFRTKRSAEDALGEALGRISAGQFSDPGRVTVGEFLDHWIDAASSGLRASTAASYRILLVKRVSPRIGRIRLASLTPGHLTKLYATLLAEGGKGAAPLCARSVRYPHPVPGKALGGAVDWGLLARNPARSAKPPRVVKPEMSVWSTDEAKRFLVAVRDDRLHPLWLLMLTTGMRRAEVAGLRWVDVNLDVGVISIRQTRVAVDFTVFISEPKTATSRRPIALDSLTIEAPSGHRPDAVSTECLVGITSTGTRGTARRATHDARRATRDARRK